MSDFDAQTGLTLADAERALEYELAVGDERLFSTHAVAALATIERSDRPRFDSIYASLAPGERSIVTRRVRELTDERSKPNDAPREIDLAALVEIDPQPPAFIIPSHSRRASR